MKAKKRLDQLVYEAGLAPSRSAAQGLILSGAILVNNTPCTKSGQLFFMHDSIRVKASFKPLEYVSRGGIKLAAALDTFAISPQDKTAFDIGASTGGFSDVLLQRGIKKIFCIDVGHNQLNFKIRSDPRVIVKENINARYLKWEDLQEHADLIVMDVSFISQTKILPALPAFCSSGSILITLIKPQFEVGRAFVGKNGIVKDEKASHQVIENIKSFAQNLNFFFQDILPSPLLGSKGNQEYLAYFIYQGALMNTDNKILKET